MESSDLELEREVMVAAKYEIGVRGRDEDWIIEREAAAVAQRWRCCAADEWE